MPFTKDGGAEESCAREPIHIIGRTQAHGFLIAVSEPHLAVRFVSANLAQALGTTLDNVLERPLESVLGDREAPLLRASLREPDLLIVNPLPVRVGDLETDCVAHRHAGMLILEMEPRGGTRRIDPLNVATHLQGPIARMQREDDIERLAFAAAAEVRSISGFERVIVYRFDRDWHGEVIAEVSDGAPKYLGHHFPASDIPAQARHLFLINTLRTIVDAEARPVPVVPVLGAWSGKPLDLSRSLLRSASPIHLEYLRNMGVRATMTMSVIVRGRLWGMITAHHRAPHRLGFTTRAVCDLLGQIFAAHLVARTDNTTMQVRLSSRDRIEAYMSALEGRTSSAEDAFDSPTLLKLLRADGLIIHVDGASAHFGSTVEESRLLPVVALLRARSARGVAESHALSSLEPAAAEYAQLASGALYIGLSDAGDEFVLLLRREFVETLLWAGDPEKPSASGGKSGQLHPRLSFDTWQQTLRGRSRPWNELDLENARLLREQFMQLREAHGRQKAEARVRFLARNDVLTSLPNRNTIHETLHETLVAAALNHSAGAVFFVDLDRFKYYNDRFGHAAGDRILQIVASRMSHSIRSEDVAGRLGGDEFIVILPGLETQDETLGAARRILAEIERPLEIGEGERVSITASIGISRYPSDGTTADMLLQHADSAMYRAKGAGRNAYEFFS